MKRIPNVRSWLRSECTSQGNPAKYRHLLIKEIPDAWRLARRALRRYFKEAHKDARHYLRTLGANSLDPLGAAPTADLSYKREAWK